MTDQHLQDLAHRAVTYATTSGVSYCDARAEEYKETKVRVENCEIDHVVEGSDSGLGIRMLTGGVWRFVSITGPELWSDVRAVIDDMSSARSAPLVSTRDEFKFHKAPAKNAKIRYPVREHPSYDDMIRIGLECSSTISDVDGVTTSITSPRYRESSKYFVNSEGADILQEWTDTVITMTATANTYDHAQSIDATIGGRGGLEMLTDKECSISKASEIAVRASELTAAGLADSTEKTDVVLNPNFVALLTHEILGHPSEADRVLGKEMAWAGGAWWSGMLGQKIGADTLSVFDDPTIKNSLGWYKFDDEGVETQKTVLIEDGVLKKHMQSRETAALFGACPTGNMRAAGYEFAPLIRMACTCVAPGDWNIDEMIKEISDGYLICDMKVPSIDMRRYNWNISCQYAQKIRGGELKEMVRDVIVSGMAPDFFESVQACGDDFTVSQITNCGKGDPMQSLAMGNGGPSIWASATVGSVGA